MKIPRFSAIFQLFWGCCLAFSYQTRFFTQKVDHFGYSNADVFPQRYLFSDAHRKGPHSPIFFYTGNEGDVSMFANNTGWMWELAEEFGAVLVFAEHRYYGQSLPYGSRSYQNLEYLGYLTSEQALADYALLIQRLKSNFSGSPVVVFGGSYGGMLSAWMRIKYPHLVVGALASSAPVLQFTGLTPCHVYYRIVTQDFRNSSPECARSIRRSWKVLREIAQTEEGRGWLTRTFRLCRPLSVSTVDALVQWISGTWSNLAMTDYPYPTDFLAPLPARPVQVACRFLAHQTRSDRTLLRKVMRAVSVFHNYTGRATCFDLSRSASAALGEEGWDFQSCTEMVMPMCTDGIHDMFEPSVWNLTRETLRCRARWKVSPEAFRAQLFYGGRNISAASRIIFSNGLLDPWSGGGVTRSPSPTVVALVMEGAAHHLDLRSSNPRDPASVVAARIREKRIIAGWIQRPEEAPRSGRSGSLPPV